MKILIMGLPGSGKTTLAETLSPMLPNSVRLNADEIRKAYDDWDFTEDGRRRQAERMGYLADGIVMCGKVPVADFVCPIPEYRESYGPDYTVWMDTIREGRFEDTNKLFVPPKNVNYTFTGWENKERMAKEVYYDFCNFLVKNKETK